MWLLLTLLRSNSLAAVLRPLAHQQQPLGNLIKTREKLSEKGALLAQHVGTGLCKKGSAHRFACPAEIRQFPQLSDPSLQHGASTPAVAQHNPKIGGRAHAMTAP